MRASVDRLRSEIGALRSAARAWSRRIGDSESAEGGGLGDRIFNLGSPGIIRSVCPQSERDGGGPSALKFVISSSHFCTLHFAMRSEAGCDGAEIETDHGAEETLLSSERSIAVEERSVQLTAPGTGAVKWTERFGFVPVSLEVRLDCEEGVTAAGESPTLDLGSACTEHVVPPVTSDNSADSETVRSNGSSSELGSSEGEQSVAKKMRIEVPTLVLPDEVRERRIAAAWEHWKRVGAPKLHVAPMVDQSELPFRMLCRKYGATAAYTPMLHSRLYVQDNKYRKEFTTCPEDRPLFVQFCANNPETLLEAGRLVESQCDYVDLNLGCPQRIAKRGNYGAFLMENLPLIQSLVSNLASNLTTPVSCKIRVFPNLEDTLAYARMLEEAGCSLLAVHGRTREQKNGKAVRADWEAIKAVKKALKIPVLANGNIRWLEDVESCIAATGVDGVMSAESLLENPALFGGYRVANMSRTDACEGKEEGSFSEGRDQPHFKTIDERQLCLEYLELCEKYPVPMRMVRGHVHKILGNFWFKHHPDFREQLNKQYKLTLEWLKDMVERMMAIPHPMKNSVVPSAEDTQSPDVELSTITTVGPEAIAPFETAPAAVYVQGPVSVQ